MQSILPYPRVPADLPERLVEDVIGYPMEPLTDDERADVLAAAERAAGEALSRILERRDEREGEERRYQQAPASAFPPPLPLPPETKWQRRRFTASFVAWVGAGCLAWVAVIGGAIAWAVC